MNLFAIMFILTSHGFGSVWGQEGWEFMFGPPGTNSPPIHVCDVGMESCWGGDSGLCYKESSRCDNYFDCPDGIDEFLCKQEPDVRCKVGEIKCGLSKICRPWNSRCNGVNDCPGGEDEFDCPLALNPPTITQCDCGQLFCDGICKPAYRICDNVADCRDNRDESNCRIPPPRVRQVSTIAVWEDRFEQHTLTVRWWMDALDSNAYFLPSLCDSLSRWCMNATIWTRETSYQLQDGKDGIRMLPFWRYYVKIFVKIGNDVYPPGVYKEIQTACSDKPGVPQRVRVEQISYNQVNVSWRRPAYVNGFLRMYYVYSQPVIENPWGDVYYRADNEWFVFEVPTTFQTITFWVRTRISNLMGNNLSKPSLSTTHVMVPVCKFIVEPHSTYVLEHQISLDWTTIGLCTDLQGIELFYNDYQNISAKTMVVDAWAGIGENFYKFDIPGLTPGTSYNVTVTPFTNGIPGKPHTHTVATQGKPAASVSNLRASRTGPTSVKVQWEYPQGETSNFMMLYWKSGEDRTVATEILVTGMWHEFADLDSCSTYTFNAYLFDPYTKFRGDPYAETITETTGTNLRDPPRHVRVFRERAESMQLKVDWKAPCLVRLGPLNYVVAYRETGKGIKPWINIPVIGGNRPDKLRVALITAYGASYELKIKTSMPDAIYSEIVQFRGGDIPVVDRIEQLTKISKWVTIGFDYAVLPPQVFLRGRTNYFVLVSQDMNDDTPDRFEIEAGQTTYEFDKFHFQAGVKYFAAIELIDGAGYKSPTSDWIPLDISK